MIGNILIVDDEPGTLKLLKDVLAADGHVVRPFNNGELALRSIMHEAPELILVDIRMPGMNGFEVCRRIKEDERLKEIPVIFISAASDMEDKLRAFQEGGVDYITKPFQKEEVIARVRTQIALSHTAQRMKKTVEALQVREESLKVAQAIAHRSEDNLIRAQAVAQIGSWHLDIASNRLEWTAESFRIFGVPQKEAVDLETFFSTVHPDDREMVLKSWNEAIAGAPYDIEHRVVADGEIRWVRERAVIARDSDGRAISGIGTTQDITDRKRVDMEIRRLERNYRSLAENLPDIISRFDRKLRRIYVNPVFEKYTGMPCTSVLGKTHAELEIPDNVKKIWSNVLHQVFSTGEQIAIEFELPAPGGGVKYYQAITVPEFNASGEVETVLTIARDISILKNTEMVLRENEERLHAIASNVPGMVLQCCRRAGENRLWFTYVSHGAKDLLNIEAVEILRDENEFIGRIVREHVSSFHDSLAQSQSGMTLWNWEGCVTAADGSRKWINLRATPHLHGKDICMWEGVAINVSESKANEIKLIQSKNMLRELAAHLESVREEERKYVAREIHDELGQALTALKMDISLTRLSFGKDHPQLMNRLQSMTQLMDRTIDIARHITSSLRPGVLDLGIVAAMEWLTEEFTGYTGIPCELILCDGNISLNETTAVAAFRIVQESLTNIARHATATQAEIIVNQADGHLCLEVRDNGKGFDPHLVESRKSFGLTGIRERVAMLEGEFMLDSEPGRGTCIRVCVPVA